MRSFELMADYQCYPLWETTTPDDYGDVDPGTLPISQDLVQKLDEWRKAYDAILNWDDPASPRFESPEAKTAFIQRGRVLAARLQEELGPDFDMTFRYPGD